MEAQSDGNLFNNVEPHWHLPGETRAALWAACERVRNDPGKFADAAAWLDREYSESALRERKLKDSERMYRGSMLQLGRGMDRCDTFPRRKALRAGRPKLAASRRLALLQRFSSTPELAHIPPEFIVDLSEHPEKVREWVVRLSGSAARSRGHRIEDGNVVLRSHGEVGEQGLPDEKTVEIYWRWLDENCRRDIRYIKKDRQERDADIRDEVKDRIGRFHEAVRDAVKGGIPMANRVECSRRLVLLAAMIAAPEPVSLSAEFGDMRWESEGNILGIGGPYMPGRETLIKKLDFLTGATQWTIAGFTADGFGSLIARAVNEIPPNPATAHNSDFTMVMWYGTEYHFALGVQSSAIQALWNEWERSGLGLHQDTIRNAIDAERDNFRMDTTFRNHPAFGTMIQRCGDGKYKLARPTPKPTSVAPKTK